MVRPRSTNPGRDIPMRFNSSLNARTPLIAIIAIFMVCALPSTTFSTICPK